MNKIIRHFFILSYYNFKLDWQGVYAVVMASAIIHYFEIRTIINMVHYARYLALNKSKPFHQILPHAFLSRDNNAN